MIKRKLVKADKALEQWLFPNDGTPPKNRHAIQKYLGVSDKTLKKKMANDEILEDMITRACEDYAAWIVEGMINETIEFRVGSFILRCNHGWVSTETQKDLDRKERELQHRIEMDKIGDASREKPPISINFSIATKDDIQVNQE